MKIQYISLLLIPILMSSCGNNDADESMTRWLDTPAPGDVRITDSFWKPKIDLNREVTIPYVFSQCEETGRIDNFAIAGGLKKGKHTGERYNDSDVFKVIEGACYSLSETPDPALRHYVDSLVTLIAAAQEDDGYLYTTRTIDPVNMAPGAGRERWIDERVSHELYNVGHMYEAAVAHFEATGSKAFLDIALKNAELINNEFGWGKREIAPGHQEIEIGLVKLYKCTGEKKWLDLAQFFLDVRGRRSDYILHPMGSRFDLYNDSVYFQMHKPVLEQTEAVGHAVRGAYMYTAMADVSEETGYDRYLEASQKIWNDVTAGKIYITGGIGSKEHGEAFGEPFELPNMTAYTETCASVANVFWNHRLYQATGEAKYLDVLERTLYNGLISGIGSDGCHFFYPNPLESDGSFERAGWFDCSCCPVNVARFMPSMKQYIWSESGDGVNVNLFIGSEARLNTSGGEIFIRQTTDFPWKGDVKINVEPDNQGSAFRLRIRVPGWIGNAPMDGGLYSYITPVKGKMEIKVNGRKITPEVKQGFAVIDRKWNKGDVVDVTLPLEPRFMAARQEVKADSGRTALGIGPMVYCLEEADNGKVREIKVNGRKITPEVKQGFAVIDRKWNKGDVVDVTLPLEPRFMAARQEVKADSGRTALGIGPMVYCLEEADNGKVREIKVDPETTVDIVFDDKNPAAALTLEFDALTPDGPAKKVRAVPYYSWANRGKGEMIVWMKNK